MLSMAVYWACRPNMWFNLTLSEPITTRWRPFSPLMIDFVPVQFGECKIVKQYQVWLQYLIRFMIQYSDK